MKYVHFLLNISTVLLLISTTISCTPTFAQTIDSTTVFKKDTTIVKQKHNPKLATKRSLILPGWGQAYNKEYWKIPIVYGALSIPTITYFYNNNVYKETRFAYDARFKAATLLNPDSTDYKTLEPKYKTASIQAIQSVRNASRRDRDFSILWFLIVWGLNVADATVFGHLKDFDVSSDLSMNIKPNFNPTTQSTGLSFVFNVKNKFKKQAIIR